jgi:hypothetical protein
LGLFAFKDEVVMRGKFIGVLVMMLIVGCVHAPFKALQPPVVDPCNGVSATFGNDIQPILKATCAKAGCHDGNEMPADYSVYDNIKVILDDSAFYYAVIKNRNMPQDTALTDAQYKLVQCWLGSGGADN